MTNKLEPIQTDFVVSELNDGSPLTFNTSVSNLLFDINTLNKVLNIIIY